MALGLALGDAARRRLSWPLGWVGLILLVALLAPLIAPHDPVTMDVANRLAEPSWTHWLGQDEYGRDVLSRLIWGARVSLAVAISSALIAGVIGVTIGLVGGYFGGLAELFTVRLTDVILSFPPILLALLVVTLLGPGAGTLTLVLSILYVPSYARVTYGEVLSARALEYVEAARAAGATAPRILLRTILPNIFGPILVQFSLTVASAIVIESGLSFLGLGVVPPAPSWGLMIRGARGTMEHNWTLLVWPCAALVATILGINQLCDAMRDVLDPRTASQPRPKLLAQLAEAALAFPQARGAAAAAPAATAEATNPVPETVLDVRDLRTQFFTVEGAVKAVDGVSFEVRRGETLAVVGESGSGKSVTGLSILGLVPQPAGRIVGGQVLFRDRDGAMRDLVALDEAALQEVRGDQIAMVFQEPMTSLNPVWRVGEQIAEAVVRHRRVGRAEARAVALAMLETVGIPDAAARIDDFPHQLSGGMRQRAMIAMALSCGPQLLIADEPTTALDVTIQAQILDLLRRLRQESASHGAAGGMSILFITHNFGVVAEMADRVLVMYAGRVVEQADVRAIFRRPRHPYTKGLLASIPQPGDAAAGQRATLNAIPGTVPSLRDLAPGCVFAPRCELAEEACRAAEPGLAEIAPGHFSRCRRWSLL